MEEDKGLTLDEAMISAGGFGKFQIFMLIFYIMSFTAGNFLLYNYDFLVQYPVYMCETEPDSEEYIECTNVEICESDP